MKLTKLFLLLASASALVISSDRSAFAANSAEFDLGVSATVVKSCSISTSPVTFSNYDPLQSTTDDGTGGYVTVTCSKGSGTSVALDYGANTSGSGSTQPRMKNGTANYLNYKLYSDTLHQTLWSGTSVALTPASADTPTAQTLYVYGQIPATQNVPPGVYSDTVQATVNF
jgi:spore coat protein U-like protein